MEDSLSVKLAALASPTRRAILARLAEGDAPLSELAAPFRMTVPAIAKHLAVLENAGLVRRGERSRFRPVQLERASLGEIAAWLDRCRASWEGGFDRLEAYLARSGAGESHE